jgi:hypothetical protein
MTHHIADHQCEYSQVLDKPHWDHIVGQAFNHSWCTTSQIINWDLIVGQAFNHSWCTTSQIINWDHIVGQAFNHSWCTTSQIINWDHIVGQSFNHSWCTTSQIINICTPLFCALNYGSIMSLAILTWNCELEMWRDGNCVRWWIEMVIDATWRVWGVTLAYHDLQNETVQLNTKKNR